MKATIGIVLGIILSIGLAVFGWQSCQRGGWESALRGPYAGLVFTNNLTNQPVSILPIPSRGQLEVHEVAFQIGPVLALRSEAGTVQWCRLLVPERKAQDGSVERAGVRALRLRRLERDRHGYEVLFSCDWDWGGREGGFIGIDNNYAFQDFRISW